MIFNCSKYILFRAQCNLGNKYGVSPEKAPALVEMAVRMKMNLVGAR